MKLHILTLSSIIAFLAAILTYMEKKIMEKTDQSSYLIIRYLTITIFFLFIIYYQKINTTSEIQKILKNNSILYLLFIWILSVCFVYGFYEGINNYSMTTFYILFTILNIIFISFIGVYLNGEKMNTTKLIGIIISCIGVYLILNNGN